VTVALNLGAQPVSVTSNSIGFGSKILLSTFLDRRASPSMACSTCAAMKASLSGESDHAG